MADGTTEARPARRPTGKRPAANRRRRRIAPRRFTSLLPTSRREWRLSKGEKIAHSHLT